MTIGKNKSGMPWKKESKQMDSVRKTSRKTWAKRTEERSQRLALK
jgi:hypothetical protein